MSTTYTVKKGDNLSKIAREYGTTYQEIAKENGISNPDLIHPGQKLTIGGQKGNAAKPAAVAPKTNAGGGVKNADKPAASAPEAAPAATPVTSPGGFTYGDFQYDSFDPMADENIKQAWDILGQHGASNPGEFTDPNNYKGTYLGYLNQFENRDHFSYDFNSDALYNQYKDQYIQQGQMAMMDTMGQAAAMTGGYGNSYAQTVGQQAYNQYLGQLNEVMPELYNMAYGRYQQEGQEMLDMYNAYLGLYQNDYNMHQDSVDNWYRENSRLTENYNTLYDHGYDDYLLRYNTSLNEYNTSRNEAFTTGENDKEREFTAGENQKSREFTAGENQKDREAAANKASAAAKDDKLNTMELSKQKEYQKEADRAVKEKGIDGLYEVGASLERAGYSDSFIEDWIKSEIERLFPEKKQEPEQQQTVPTRNPTSRLFAAGVGDINNILYTTIY